MPDDLTDFERDAGPSISRPEPERDRREDLLTMDEREAGRKVVKLWEAQDAIMRPRIAEWKANKARRQGIANVLVVKDKDTKEVKVWVPPGPQMPVLNKADRLCRRLAAFMFSDPPRGQAIPSRDDDQAREAAEFATRVLDDLSGESQLDDAMTARQAFDRASVYGSGFRRYWVDPTGGGQRPIEILANPQVTAVAEALENPGPEPHVKRYATVDGQLVDDPNAPGVKLQWIPKLKVEVLTGKHVRFLPPTAADIWAAEGALVATMIPWGQLRAMFHDRLEALDEDEVAKLIQGQPKGHEELLPASRRRSERWAGARQDDDTPVFVLTLYYKQCGRFPEGIYMIVAGEGLVLHRGPWKDPERPHENILDIPIDQFKQFDDEDEPYGRGLMNPLGSANELRNAMTGTFLEHLDRFLNRKVFYPVHSTFQPKQAQSATGTHIPINQGGEPRYEEVPDFPRAAEKMLDFVSTDMDDESGLQQVAQGLNPPGVKSGLHAQQITEQVIAAISDLRANTVRALQRGWRIQLQQVRAFYSVPQRMAWVGEDGAFKERMWRGADLGSTSDVRLHRGSFTSMTPAAKAAVAEQLYSLQVLDVQELERIAIAQVGGQIGLQDNPHRLRVRRQIERWKEGPPEGWAPPEPELDEQTGEEVIPPDPVLSAIFDPRPVDDLPDVASIRLIELGRLLSSVTIDRYPPDWVAGLIAEFERARAAAGVQTAREQAEAAQAQQQAAEQAAQAELAAKQADTAAKVQVAEITSQGEIEEEKIQADAAIRQELIRADAAKAPDVNVAIKAGT